MGTTQTVLTRKRDFDESQLEIGGVCLGFDRIALLFFLGPAEGGGNLILIEGDGESPLSTRTILPTMPTHTSWRGRPTRESIDSSLP